MAFPRAFQTYIPRTHCIQSHVYGVILVSRNGETAVIKGRKSGKWSFPKGHGRTSELPLQAGLRELKEETGVDMTGVQPDDEIRFRSGTYFVFFVDEQCHLSPEDLTEVQEAMWTPMYRLQYLLGNKDLTSFCKSVSIGDILDKMAAKVALSI